MPPSEPSPASHLDTPESPSAPAPQPAYAHTTPGPIETWEPLEQHLHAVGERASALASGFGAEAWGRLAGLWHDLGKYSPEFQAYLRGRLASGGEHAGLGAALAAKSNSGWSRLLSFVIAGHHAGLANNDSNAQVNGDERGGLPTPLTQRLRENAARLSELLPLLPPSIVTRPLPPPPSSLAEIGKSGDRDEASRAITFWTRMLFSALVDADRLETAEFYARHAPAARRDRPRHDSIAALRDRLDGAIDDLARRAHADPMSPLRAEVLQACRSAASRPPGRYSLTVPTGGGKTLAAMSFALNHTHPRGADQRLRRVIVVIPYTSIIEQNAAVYRKILGADNVLEHHSNLDEARLSEADPEREARRKLAAENWDAPVVVTTTVQFLESLYSNHPSRCRKLHNIARSVIILDEVQTLPPHLLAPILDALRELTARYGCTVVLSTATPPALAQRSDRLRGLEDVEEIIRNPADLARRARRVHVSWEIEEPVPYSSLARRLAGHERVLAIVHRRRDARELAEAVEREAGGAGLFHLSALMCPAHRLAVLERIRETLSRGGPCRVVATQLVEAGVDLDFPIVYRALAGLDSIAQAAGRCDREGRLTAARGGEPGGRLIVFRPETDPPPGVLTKAAQSTSTLLSLRGQLDPFDPDTCRDFFHDLYGKHDLDQHGILRACQQLNFATIAARFRMIDALSRPVVVVWSGMREEIAARIEAFHNAPTREAQRALQPFIVQVSPQHHSALLTAGALESLHDRVEVLTEPFWSRYDNRFGLDIAIDGAMDPEVAIG